MPPQDIVGDTTAAVATVIVALRIFTRLQVRRQSLDGSDYTDDQAAFLSVREGTFEYIASTARGLALASIKVSILLFYLRLSRAKWVRWAVILVSTFVVLYIFLNIIYEALAFVPELAETIANGNRGPEGRFWYAANIATNLCCLLIPAAIVLPLELRAEKKVSIIALFGLCGIPNVAGIWSCVFFLRMVPRLASEPDQDIHFQLRDYILRTNLRLILVECNGAIICAGIPTIWIFFTHFLPSMIQYYLHPSRHVWSETRATTTSTRRLRSPRKPPRRASSYAPTSPSSGARVLGLITERGSPMDRRLRRANIRRFERRRTLQ
ncbi:hypothetical protein PG994_001446 [Apiospora phragmitis]|uniref:Rhodopsin domain-containing protein n=1 Tax=Apiospora phragmitis TaxID=2905665 RepID=A0ABR1WTL7_9PEZI